MPDFRLVAPFEPTGDQPLAIDRLVDGLRPGPEAPDAARRDRHRQDVHDRPDDRGPRQADPRPRPQQDAGGPALRRVPRVLPGQRGRVLRQLLRLLPARGVPAPERHLHREGLVPERRDRPAPPRGDPRPLRAPRRDHRGLGLVHLRPRRPGRLRGDGPPPPRRAARTGATPSSASSSTSSTSATTRPCTRARFRVRGDTLEFQPASEETLVRVEFFGDEVERITEVDPLTGELLAERKEVNVYPASHYVTPADKLKLAIVDIEAEMEERVGQLEAEGRVLEAARLRQRTTFDLEMMRELGFCTGIENYSRHLSRREAGSRPWTLLDYFPPDWLLVVDESHMTIPQVVGMYKNDRTRKEILVDFGFRLPSALDNRPLTFEEFEGHLNQVVHMSATPGPVRARAERADRRAADPADRRRRPVDRRPPDRRPDRRPDGGDPAADRARRAGPRHDADEEDGRGPDRLPARARGQGPVPPQRGRHARARGDPARPPPRRVRRPRRDQPPARGDRPARGDARRDPRRRQGGLPAELAGR